MKKVKYTLVSIILILVVLSTTGSLGNVEVENKNPSSMGAVLDVTTDKTTYGKGEPVAIFLTNVGDDTLRGGGPIITIYNNKNEIVYQDACYCWHELKPGEYIAWPPWDQKDQQGVQVPTGRYTVEGILFGGKTYIDTATFYIINGHFLAVERVDVP